MTPKQYIVATTKSWNIRAFENFRQTVKGEWFLATNPAELNELLGSNIQPRYIFFPHWSWKVEAELYGRYECVCFHMTDVPFGRGGSPLQNLIVRGIKQTKLTALRMVEEMDAGPVYFKEPLDLTGSAEEIFQRATKPVYQMVRRLVEQEPTPQQQEGDPVFFERRKPEQSHLPEGVTLEQLYDHIRMLDAESYPPAFLEHDAWRLEFSGASLQDGVLTASVTFRNIDEGKS